MNGNPFAGDQARHCESLYLNDGDRDGKGGWITTKRPQKEDLATDWVRPQMSPRSTSETWADNGESELL